MSRQHVILVDPELPADVVAEHVPAGSTVVTLFNPLQDDVLTHCELPVTPPDYRTSRDRFDELHAAIVDARRAGVARCEVAGLDQHEVDLAAIAEVGFATEIHISLALLFAELQPREVTVLARRAVFADVARTFFAQRGVEITRLLLAPRGRAASRRGHRSRVVAATAMAARWFGAQRRVFSAVHRQTRPVADALPAHGVAVATPQLASLLGVATGRLVRGDVGAARGATERLRAFAADRFDDLMLEAWHSTLAYFVERLPHTLAHLERSLCNFDLLQPDALLAPAWGGVDAHAFRAWASSRGVPFAVVQHGFNIGSYPCLRTRSVDADVFYAWSDRFVDDWVNPAWNERVDVVALGNPAYDGIHHRGARGGDTVMLAPAGVLEFGRDNLLDYWDTAFEMVEARPDARWKLRPHPHGRNNDWIRMRAEKLGAVWSRDTEPGLDDALDDVDILVTMVSSVAIDAIVRGILVVLVNHLGETPLMLPDVCAGYVEDRHRAAAVVGELLDSPKARIAAYERQRRIVDAYPTSGVADAVAADLAARIPTSR